MAFGEFKKGIMPPGCFLYNLLARHPGFSAGQQVQMLYNDIYVKIDIGRSILLN